MRKVKGKIAVTLLFPVLLLGGCRTEYDRRDIFQYLKGQYDIPGFIVGNEPQEMKDGQGYTDYLWTVRLKNDSELVFHVLDDTGWGMESVSNYLWTDFDDVVMCRRYEEYGEMPRFTLEVTRDEEHDVMISSILTASFETEQQLQQLFRELQDFSEFYEENGYGTQIRVNLQMENPLRYRCAYVVDDGDYVSSPKAFTAKDYETARNKYILTCLDYRFEDQLKQFTEEEIAEALKDYRYCIGISRDGTEDGEPDYYDDLCANQFAYGVSFGTLYEILSREGIEIEGNSWHYSFQGIDGSLYEISYDFCDYPFETDTGTCNGYYYLKDGEKVPMAAYFYNHFTKREIREITGLVLTIGERK